MIYLYNVYGNFRRYFAGGICKCNTDLTGKIVIVTGGSAGIGKEITLALAERGKVLIKSYQKVFDLCFIFICNMYFKVLKW